eukprot:TRINITY_DN62766_c0_g1_i1.p1 TRINITY_DN62766_c0_g1~~TRINITY_DN62766_c0_g1_i1.p1  ORF type:complete len:573 (-),score=96.16 TRINITY_DN62766_c0_g1_i1:56-1774(-)
MGFLRIGQGSSLGGQLAATGSDMDDTFDFEADIDAKDIVRAESLRADGTTSAEGSANRGTRTVCKHWLKNLCMKGDKCEYLHQYDPNRMPECFFFLKTGKCTDPECVFKHVAATERPECQRYRLGYCKFGPLCRSRHDRLPKDKIPDVLPDWFLNSLLVNSHLVPRAEDVNLSPSEFRGRSSELALSVISGEQGAIPGLPPPVHGKCRFFVMRSVNLRNVQISASKGIWATGGGNTQKLRQGFREVDHVIMIFTSSETRTFLGYARMVDEPDDMLFPGIWGEFSSRLSPSFKVHWIKQCSVPCSAANHIRNSLNDDQPVSRGKDGQELPASVGERLCRFLWQQPEEDLLKGSDLEFEPRVSYDYPAGETKEQEIQAPLALEDVKKDDGTEIDEGPRGPRPAPVPLGTFQREAKEGKVRLGSTKAPVAVGKALASGSSSLLAAMAEEEPPDDEPRVESPPPGNPGWPPPQHHHMPPPEWGHLYPPPPGPGYFHPPPFHPHHPPHPYGYPPPHMAMPPPHYDEGRPPGTWVPGRAPFAQPPSDWQGASGSAPGAKSGRRRHGERSRSRARKRHR